MKINLTTKQKGIIVFVLFAIGLTILTFLSIQASIPPEEEDIYAAPKPTQTSIIEETPTKDTPLTRTEELDMNDLAMVTLNLVAGYDYRFPFNPEDVSNLTSYSDEVKIEILEKQASYNVEQLAAEQYVKILNPVTFEDVSTPVDDKKGIYVYQITVSVDEGKNGVDAQPTGSKEVWQVSIQKRNYEYVVIKFEQVS